MQILWAPPQTSADGASNLHFNEASSDYEAPRSLRATSLLCNICYMKILVCPHLFKKRYKKKKKKKKAAFGAGFAAAVV